MKNHACRLEMTVCLMNRNASTVDFDTDVTRMRGKTFLVCETSY